MKRYLPDKLADIVDIDTYFCVEHGKVSASSIRLITDGLGNVLDEQAYKDYLKFILNVESIILNLDFDIIDKVIGDNGISHYYYLRAKDERGNPIPGMIYRVRISDHIRSENRMTKDRQELANLRNRSDLVNENDGKSIKVRFSGLIVNQDTCNSYEEAEVEAEDRLRSIRTKMQVKKR